MGNKQSVDACEAPFATMPIHHNQQLDRTAATWHWPQVKKELHFNQRWYVLHVYSTTSGYSTFIKQLLSCDSDLEISLQSICSCIINWERDRVNGCVINSCQRAPTWTKIHEMRVCWNAGGIHHATIPLAIRYPYTSTSNFSIYKQLLTVPHCLVIWVCIPWVCCLHVGQFVHCCMYFRWAYNDYSHCCII